MLATSKNVLFPCHNHLLTPDTDDPSLYYHPRWRLGDNQSVGSSVPVVSRWLWPRNRIFLEVASMVVTWWIVAFLRSVTYYMLLLLWLVAGVVKWWTRGSSIFSRCSYGWWPGGTACSLRIMLSWNSLCRWIHTLHRSLLSCTLMRQFGVKRVYLYT